MQDNPLQTQGFALFLALAIGLVGAFLALALSFPAPYLTGPALVVSIAALAGLRLSIPDWLRNVCFVAIGVTIGSTVTREMVATALEWPLAIGVLMVAVTLMMLASTQLLTRFFHYDRTTAILAATPGHLSYILSITEDQKADMKAVGIVQSFRLLTLTLAVPFLIVAITGLAPTGILSDTPPMGAGSLIAVLIGSVIAGFVFQRFNVPAAFLNGGMFAAAIGHLSTVTPGSSPEWMAIPAFTIMGTLIGTRFVGLTLRELRRALAAALSVSGIAGVLTVLSAGLVAYLLDLPLAHVLVAFAPGGLEAMAAMALLLEANPAFVMAHHIMRLLLLTFLVPLMLPKKETR